MRTVRASFNRKENDKEAVEIQLKVRKLKQMSDFSGGTVDKNLPATAGDMGLIPAPGRSHMPRSNEAQDPQLLKFLNRAHALQQETPPQ